jgi:hypothetical protein
VKWSERGAEQHRLDVVEIEPAGRSKEEAAVVEEEE